MASHGGKHGQVVRLGFEGSWKPSGKLGLYDSGNVKTRRFEEQSDTLPLVSKSDPCMYSSNVRCAR